MDGEVPRVHLFPDNAFGLVNLLGMVRFLLWKLLHFATASGLVVLGLGTYSAYQSTLARPGIDDPCPPFPLIIRVFYFIFSTRPAHLVLGWMTHTRPGKPQRPQNGGVLGAAAMPPHCVR